MFIIFIVAIIGILTKIFTFFGCLYDYGFIKTIYFYVENYLNNIAAAQAKTNMIAINKSLSSSNLSNVGSELSNFFIAKRGDLNFFTQKNYFYPIKITSFYHNINDVTLFPNFVESKY
jgi:hypothetical protein